MFDFLSFLWLSDFLTGYRYEDCIDLFQVVYKLFVLYTLHDMLIIDYSGEGVHTSFLHQYKYMYFYTVVCSLVPSICISMYIRIILQSLVTTDDPNQLILLMYI